MLLLGTIHDPGTTAVFPRFFIPVDGAWFLLMAEGSLPLAYVLVQLSFYLCLPLSRKFWGRVMLPTLVSLLSHILYFFLRLSILGSLMATVVFSG